MTACAGPDFEDVEVRRPLMLQARERSVANRSRQMRLAFLDRLCVIRRGHRILAEASIIQLFDVHASGVAQAGGTGKLPLPHRNIVKQAVAVTDGRPFMH